MNDRRDSEDKGQVSDKGQAKKGIQIGLEYEVEVRDKDGKLLSKDRGKAHSFVRNWIKILRTLMNVSSGGDVNYSLTDTGGTSRAFYGATASALQFTAIGALCVLNYDTYGIQVGTSNTAFDRTQYSLQGKIAHGSGGGQLQYGNTVVEDSTETDSQARYRVTRDFVNASGATITVREIGIVIANNRGGTTYFFLICRDVLGTPRDVPNGATLSVRYILTISYT